MKGQSYLAKTILEQYDGRKKTFLAFKDSPGNPLGHSSSKVTLLREGKSVAFLF